MKTMCRVLDVSESGYSAWGKREPSQRQMESERLTEQIAQAFYLGRGVYGSPRIPGSSCVTKGSPVANIAWNV